MIRIAALLLVLKSPCVMAETIRLEGEVASLDSVAIGPPVVRDVWNFQITQMLAEGTAVKAGDPVVSFDGSELQRRLAEATAQLKQRQSEHGKLQLGLAERERTDRLATAEQLANLKKADRKAELPAGIVRSVDYRKLVIDREHSARRYQLVLLRQQLADRLRKAEMAAVVSDVARAQTLVNDLNRGVASLTVVAPRDGTVVIKTNFQGERFEVGSQVFIGQAVAEIPDPGRLVVRATVPERDMLKLAVGMMARVSVQGGNAQRLTGRIIELGHAVRSKSRLAPIPVLDVLIELEGLSSNLKTGTPAVVEVDPPSLQMVSP